jgi:hypothetical protein
LGEIKYTNDLTSSDFFDLIVQTFSNENFYPSIIITIYMNHSQHNQPIPATNDNLPGDPDQYTFSVSAPPICEEASSLKDTCLSCVYYKPLIGEANYLYVYLYSSEIQGGPYSVQMGGTLELPSAVSTNSGAYVDIYYGASAIVPSSPPSGDSCYLLSFFPSVFNLSTYTLSL